MLIAASLLTFVGWISGIVILILILGLLMKRLHQPYIISYILVGVLLGDGGMGLIPRSVFTDHLGELGIILLLFFIGMEISLPDFLKQWRVAVLGTSGQIGMSVLIMLGVGYLMGWTPIQSVLLGFVIALSSSAIIIKILEERGVLGSTVGKNVLSILLTQDILIVPLLILTSFMGGEARPLGEILRMLVGGILVMGILIYLYSRQQVQLPFSRTIEKDHELQVFAAIFCCFGGALFVSLFGLSPALGAFVGGMIMHLAKATRWIHDTLHAFRILFVALFFINVGLQIDLRFIYDNLAYLLLVLCSVYICNHLLNALILSRFSENWQDAILGGAYLAQIGELSFLLGLTALQVKILDDYGYTFVVSLISLTLIISPFWIALAEFWMKKKRVGLPIG